jgi:predicted ATPase
MGHPVTLCIALIWAVSVSLWTGDCEGAKERIDAFAEHAERHSLTPYHAVARGVRGELAVRCGRAGDGVGELRAALEALHQDRYELLTTQFTSAVSEGLASMGRLDEALVTIEDAIAQVERGGDLFALPELLRLRGELLASVRGRALREAEAVFRRSLDMAGSQGALAWELRTATSLARLWARQGREPEAHRLLASVYGRFTEGFGTADLRAAERVLTDLRNVELPGQELVR